jgi:hypothetical protein
MVGFGNYTDQLLFFISICYWGHLVGEFLKCLLVLARDISDIDQEVGLRGKLMDEDPCWVECESYPEGSFQQLSIDDLWEELSPSDN